MSEKTIFYGAFALAMAINCGLLFAFFGGAI